MQSILIAALLATCVLATGERDYAAMFRQFKSTNEKQSKEKPRP